MLPWDNVQYDQEKKINYATGGENVQMKFLFAPDSFKGTISSAHAIDMLQELAGHHFPGVQTVGIPMGDGGEGTMEALVDVLDGKYQYVTVHDPFGREIEAKYAILTQESALIEMAQASGLPLLREEERDPLIASSFGTGELIMDALGRDVREIYLMIGGSATNDGGIGMASALGIRFLNSRGEAVAPNGSGMSEITEIDLSGLDPRVKDVRFTIMCDVKNPLLGPNGATYVYGAQKGATSQTQALLEAGMHNLIDIIEKKTNADIRNKPGSGAAGGLSITLLAFANAVLRSGIETVLDILSFDTLLNDVDLVITGEGRLDYQSAQGKVLDGIGTACRKRGIPACAIVGCFGDGAEQIYDCGIDVAISCTTRNLDSEEIEKNADDRFRTAADTLFRSLKIGMGIGN